jgi:hypothetical protein
MKIEISVIDTNVLIVANDAAISPRQSRRSGHASDECVLAAVDALVRVRNTGRVGLDQLGLVLQEYANARMSYSGQPGVGDAFFKWLHQNQANPEVCATADVQYDAQTEEFCEFPQDPELAGFDRSDRKFVAICVKLGPQRTQIMNCVDSDWWNFRQALQAHKIQIEFLCPEQFGQEL